MTRTLYLLLLLLAGLAPLHAVAQRSGANDFDFEIGAWKTELSRLTRPLSGSTTWVQYKGTTVVRKVMGGPANVLELDVEGTAGRIEAMSVRLYDQQSRQWSLNFAGRGAGTFGTPAIGEFKDGRGEFFDQETFDGRAIFVRFVISRVDADTYRFEQAFSGDGGRTWELNWIATDTRMKGAT